MPPPTRTPPDKWIEEGLRALATGGPDAVRVEALARALGVTKGGFYNHFDDRPALLDEMLDTWERLTVDHVIERIDAAGGDARAKLRRLFTLSSSPSRELARIERAIREWARRDAAVARRLKRLDNRRIDYLRSQFAEFCADDDEVEVRSYTAMALFVGGPALAADHVQRRREVHRQAWERLLEA